MNTIFNYAGISGAAFEKLRRSVEGHNGLNDVLGSASLIGVPEIVTQDEFTHDVIVPYDRFFLVYDTT